MSSTPRRMRARTADTPCAPTVRVLSRISRPRSLCGRLPRGSVRRCLGSGKPSRGRGCFKPAPQGFTFRRICFTASSVCRGNTSFPTEQAADCALQGHSATVAASLLEERLDQFGQWTTRYCATGWRNAPQGTCLYGTRVRPHKMSV